MCLTTPREENSPVECQQVSLQVFDLNEENRVNLPTVYSTPTLPVSTRDMAQQEDLAHWPHLQDLVLPQIEAEVGLLIGSDAAQAFIPQEKRIGDEGPYATCTPLGWCINGPLSRVSSDACKGNLLKSDTELSQQFERFCNQGFSDAKCDEIPMSKNELKVLRITEESAVLEGNHYEVALPWKSKPPCLVR